MKVPCFALLAALAIASCSPAAAAPRPAEPVVDYLAFAPGAAWRHRDSLDGATLHTVCLGTLSDGHTWALSVQRVPAAPSGPEARWTQLVRVDRRGMWLELNGPSTLLKPAVHLCGETLSPGAVATTAGVSMQPGAGERFDWTSRVKDLHEETIGGQPVRCVTLVLEARRQGAGEPAIGLTMVYARGRGLLRESGRWMGVDIQLDPAPPAR